MLGSWLYCPRCYRICHSIKALTSHLQTCEKPMPATDTHQANSNKIKKFETSWQLWSIKIGSIYYSPVSEFCDADPSKVYNHLKMTLTSKQLLLLGWLKWMKPAAFVETVRYLRTIPFGQEYDEAKNNNAEYSKDARRRDLQQLA